MKLMIAAALAVIAVPAMGQDTTTPPPDAAAPQSTTPAPASPTVPANATITMGSPTPVVQPLADAGTPAAGEDAPWCSKSVTDHCRERSNARGARLHSTPRPPRK